ncbi:histidine phosphatase superfamily [Hypoxylon sp. FL0543]|nr:histidine phosphatase superfamily [Hypoxylon sp. FL0543]
MPPIIHVMRHAEGIHNRDVFYSHEDPPLTQNGELQCVQQPFPFGQDLIFSSPMRRTISTALLACRRAVDEGTSIILVPDLMENFRAVVNTGSELETIRGQFGARVVTDLLAEEWDQDESVNSSVVAEVQERARLARLAIRTFVVEYIQQHPDIPDPQIVVTSHGYFIPFLVGDYTAFDVDSGTTWKNAEWRSYEFVDFPGKGMDDEASLRETDDSLAKRGKQRPTAEEQAHGLNTYNTFRG